MAVSGPISNKMYAQLPCGGIGVRPSVCLSVYSIVAPDCDTVAPDSNTMELWPLTVILWPLTVVLWYCGP